ncbi:hypothetical protein Mapa_015865 [Marchantia paleacea]|nr:hypothetical protein Mapa_015865 [Marchantia paleacea]
MGRVFYPCTIPQHKGPSMMENIFDYEAVMMILRQRKFNQLISADFEQMTRSGEQVNIIFHEQGTMYPS